MEEKKYDEETTRWGQRREKNRNPWKLKRRCVLRGASAFVFMGFSKFFWGCILQFVECFCEIGAALKAGHERNVCDRLVCFC